MNRQRLRKMVPLALFCQVSLLLILGVGSFGCSQRPNEGSRVSFETASGEEITYFSLMRQGIASIEAPNLLIALPSGFEKESNAVDDINTIWSRCDLGTNTGIVVPFLDSWRFSSSSDSTSFEFGAERLIRPILSDVESRFSIENPRWGAVDIGGNGRRLVTVMRATVPEITEGYLVPAFTIHEESFSEASVSGLRVSIVVGDRPFNLAEKQLLKSGSESVSITRTDCEPLSRVGPDELRSAERVFAQFIVNMHASRGTGSETGVRSDDSDD